jgi:predicted N-acetyltransferase YhbS
VADEEGEVGHIAFSAVTIAGKDEGWMILAPLAVRTAGP